MNKSFKEMLTEHDIADVEYICRQVVETDMSEYYVGQLMLVIGAMAEKIEELEAKLNVKETQKKLKKDFKFKVGDRVLLVNEYINVLYGSKGTVIDVDIKDKEGYCVRVQFDCADIEWCKVEDLAHV